MCLRVWWVLRWVMLVVVCLLVDLWCYFADTSCCACLIWFRLQLNSWLFVMLVFWWLICLFSYCVDCLVDILLLVFSCVCIACWLIVDCCFLLFVDFAGVFGCFTCVFDLIVCCLNCLLFFCVVCIWCGCFVIVCYVWVLIVLLLSFVLSRCCDVLLFAWI